MTDPNNPQTGPAEAPAKDAAPRVPLIERGRPFVLIFLLVLLPIALFQTFRDYMYVCRIPKEMFSHCRSMTEVVIPEGITKIDEYAFNHCASLRYVTFPDSLKTISPGAFPYPNFLNSLDRETKERIDRLTPKLPPGSGRRRE